MIYIYFQWYAFEIWFILIDEENNLDFLVNESMITSALGLALCYINRILKKDDKVQDVTYRILVIKASEDSSNQYMNFMNNVFSAEKLVNKQRKDQKPFYNTMFLLI